MSNRHFNIPSVALALLLAGTAAGSGAAAARVESVAHPVHVSSLQIDLATNRKSLEVTLRMFTDDVEQAVSRPGEKIRRISATPAAVMDSVVAVYLSSRLRFGVNGAPSIAGRLLGHETEADATLFFIEVTISEAPKALVVEQRALLELFDDQNNIVHAKIGNAKRSALLRKGTERAEFTF